MHLVGFVKESKLINVHGVSNFQIVTAQQARIVYKYKNTNQKLFKTNAAIWFDKMCRINHLTPK